MPENEELTKVVKEVGELLKTQKKRIDDLEAALTEMRQTKKEKETPPPPAAEPDPLREYVKKMVDRDEKREKDKEARTKVRTRAEIDVQAAGVLSRMLKKVQQED